MQKRKHQEKTRVRYKRIAAYAAAFFVVLLILLYGISWALSFKTYPAQWGVSFHKAHAESLGLDWKQAYIAILDDLEPDHMRIAALWNESEPEPGAYVFDDLDWMMLQAAKRHVRVTLVVGQKAPRWPECHIPAWAAGSIKESTSAFLAFVKQVVTRYTSHPGLETWQVENEPFITFDFGECSGYDPQIVHDGLAVIRAQDPHRPVMITDSGELNIWWDSTRIGDILGTTIYRMVRTPTGHRFTYGWLPPGLYKIRARLFNRPYESFYVSELQGEPWFHWGDATNTAIAEQEKTMSPEILKKNIGYAERVGASRIYIWGAEWWYYMKTERGDERYWEMVKTTFQK